MKRLALIGILCLAAGTLCAEGPTATQPAGASQLLTDDEVAALRRANGETASLQKQRQRAYAELNDSVNDREAARAHLQDLTGRSDEKGVLDAIRELEDAREKACLAQTTKQARETLLGKKIADISTQVRDMASNDKITEELEHIVKMKEMEVGLLVANSKAGAVSQEEVEVAETAAADARIRLMERREAIGTTLFGDTLRVLNKELVEVSLDSDEQSALVDAIDKRLKMLREGRRFCDDIRLLDERTASLRSQLGRIQARLDELDAQQLELQPH